MFSAHRPMCSRRLWEVSLKVLQPYYMSRFRPANEEWPSIFYVLGCLKAQISNLDQAVGCSSSCLFSTMSIVSVWVTVSKLFEGHSFQMTASLD